VHKATVTKGGHLGAKDTHPHGNKKIQTKTGSLQSCY